MPVRHRHRPHVISKDNPAVKDLEGRGKSASARNFADTDFTLSIEPAGHNESFIGKS